jgi:hypothetical protein
MPDSTGSGVKCSPFCLPIQCVVVPVLWISCGKNVNYLGITKTQDIVFRKSDFFLSGPQYFLK